MQECIRLLRIGLSVFTGGCMFHCYVKKCRLVARLCALILIAGCGTGLQQTAGAAQAAAAAKSPPMPANTYLRAAPGSLIAAGDLDGDGKDEVVTWDRKKKTLTVLGYAGGSARVLTSRILDSFPSALAIADTDMDGKGELLLGEGLAGSDPADATKSEVRVSIYRPMEAPLEEAGEAAGWKATEVFRGPSTRPDVGSIHVMDIRGDKQPEILFRYYNAKYYVTTAIAQRDAQGWSVKGVGDIRMGAYVDAGRIFGGEESYVVVGRPYAEPTRSIDPKSGKTVEKIAVGDAFVLREGFRQALPVHRGVSALAIGNVRGGDAPDVVVADGWHSDYGKLARARVAILRWRNGEWDYDLIEDNSGFIRVIDLRLVDVDGDGRQEILALAQEATTYAPRLRLYQYTGSGWRGATLAEGAQAFAVADVDGNGGRELVLAGEQPKTQQLALQQLSWDATLAEAVETYKNDPDDLLGKPAPDLLAAEWVGAPQSLDALRGRVVLLDFWATWCAPCIKTFPALKEMLAVHKPEGFTIIGVTNHSGQDSADVRRFLDKKPLPWPVAIDPQSRPHMAFGSGSIPHQVLIDRKGVVRAYFVGGEQEKKIEREVVKLLGGS